MEQNKKSQMVLFLIADQLNVVESKLDVFMINALVLRSTAVTNFLQEGSYLPCSHWLMPSCSDSLLLPELAARIEETFF